jgi:dephospho-CoA kinase
VAKIRRWGLTGGIGSGKSSVGRMLAGLGAGVIDTDAVSRSLTAPGGAAIPRLAAAFGSDCIGPDGALDRQRMRTLVFEDPQARQRLEAILHPMIGEATDRAAAEWISAHEADPSITVVFEVPLLVESGRWRPRLDRIIVVDCSENTQIERVAKRSGWETDTIRRVIAAQASRWHRLACADAVIANDGIDLTRLNMLVQALWRCWRP